MMVRKTLPALIAVALSLCACNLALATENDELDMPLGVWGLDAAILPLSGFYTQIIAERYTANEVKDASGNNVQFSTMVPVAPGVSIPVNGTVDPHVTVDAVTPKFVYISDDPVWGGHIGAYVAIPFLEKSRNIAVTVTTALPPPLPGEIGQAASQMDSGSHRGVGDVEMTPFIGWKLDDWSLVAAINVDLPTGSFNKDSQVNLGTNYYSVRPLVSAAYSTESGFDLAAALSYNMSTVNHDTNYRSGQYLALEYVGSYQFSNNIKAGLQGYYLNQTTGDQDPDATALVPLVNGNKARAVSLGPVASYESDDLKTQVDFKYLIETDVRARPQGKLLMLTFSRML